MKKTLHYSNGAKSADIDVELLNGRFSISGVVYEGKKLLKSESNWISGGQCLEEARDLLPQRLVEIWERWHLNYLRAGTVAQEEALRKVKHSFNGPNWYNDACEYLKSIDLLTDNGYRYGSQWIFEPLPDEVIQFLKSL